MLCQPPPWPHSGMSQKSTRNCYVKIQGDATKYRLPATNSWGMGSAKQSIEVPMVRAPNSLTHLRTKLLNHAMKKAKTGRTSLALFQQAMKNAGQIHVEYIFRLSRKYIHCLALKIMTSICCFGQMSWINWEVAYLVLLFTTPRPKNGAKRIHKAGSYLQCGYTKIKLPRLLTLKW